MKTPVQIRIFGHAVVTVLLIAAGHATTLRAQSCSGSGSTPAFAVPEDLWLDGIFRPGDSGLSGNQIPADRDSTSWNSIGVPGFDTGWEFFESLDVVGDYLYVAYNAGISVWNIAGANAEAPQRVAVRDGWNFGQCQLSGICGPFLSFPDVAGHDQFQIEDVAVLPQGAIHYIGLSGKSPVGTSFWQFNTATQALTPIFQDTTRFSRQIRLVAVDAGRGGSTIYAFAGDDSDPAEGLRVYDFSQALATAPCLEETGSDCPGVYLGNLGSISRVFYLDILQRPTGEILVVKSDGNGASSQGLALWEVTDPSNPGTAIQLFSGLDNKTYGTALFNYEGNDYLAALENEGASNVIKIFNITACGGGGTCSLGPPIFDDIGVPPRTSNQFLTYSTSHGTPFLYYGAFGGFSGPQVEQLLNLTTLGRPGQNITEMTDGGPTYFDNCQDQNLGYWAWYYPGNEFGLKNFTPQIGKFNPDTNLFYRVGRSIVDVHVWEAVPDPTITTTVSSPDPKGLYWMGDDITFEGEGASGCDPAGTWTWTAMTPAEINAVTVNEIGNQVTYRFECVARGGRCDDAMVNVSGVNSDASCSGAITTAAALTVKDPSIEITAIDPSSGTFAQGSDVEFSAVLAGRGPVDLDWSVRRDPALDPDQMPQQTLEETVTAEDLSVSASIFTWTTASASFAGIFSDGFESGDTSAWEAPAVLAEEFVIRVELKGGPQSASSTVTLTTGSP